MDKLIDQLSEQIEAEHQEALHALDVLRRYLERATEAVPKVGSNGIGLAGRRGDPNSISGRVLSVVARDWATAEAIAEETGLALRQVRGVLNAPRITTRLMRRTLDGPTEYRLEEEQPEE